MSAVNAARGPAQPTASERTANTYSISELAQEFALTTRAIRFYEDEGLLAPRRQGLARIYGERERTRIKLILRGKRLGLALSGCARILFAACPFWVCGEYGAAALRFPSCGAPRRRQG